MFFRTFLLLTVTASHSAWADGKGVQRSGFFVDKVGVPLQVCLDDGRTREGEVTAAYGGRVACVVGALAFTIVGNALNAPVNLPLALAVPVGAFAGTAMYAGIAWGQRFPKVVLPGPTRSYGVPVAYAEPGISGPLLRLLRGAPPAVSIHGEEVPGRLVSLRFYGAFAMKTFPPDQYFRLDEVVALVTDGHEIYETPIRELHFVESCGARLRRWYRGFW